MVHRPSFPLQVPTWPHTHVAHYYWLCSLCCNLYFIVILICLSLVICGVSTCSCTYWLFTCHLWKNVPLLMFKWIFIFIFCFWIGWVLHIFWISTPYHIYDLQICFSISYIAFSFCWWFLLLQKLFSLM